MTSLAERSLRLPVGASPRLLFIVVLLGLTSGNVDAQVPDATPAFTLSSSHIFSSHEQPEIGLTFRRVDHLDFRVYRVSDAAAFFEKLKDPHQLGSEAPIVSQEQTWLERIAFWKAARRADLRAFVRGQFSASYRLAQRRTQDSRQLVRRRTLNVNAFAQVPLLNASQLVTSWRELLPPVRDSEYRRLPLDLSSPGIYVVEAISAPLKAYTVVVVSDIGLITKTAPGQLLIFAANRFTGVPLENCRVRVMADRTTVAMGNTKQDGTLEVEIAAATRSGQPDNLVTLVQCGNESAATDPGAYTIREPARELVGYIYTDRPVYRPGHIVRFKAVLRWREKGALLPAASEPVELSIVDGADKVLRRERKTVDEFGSVNGSFTVPVTASLGSYTVRVASGDSTATGSFEVQEYRKPEFDVAVRPGARFVVQGGRLSATISARYYFGAPVAGASVAYVVYHQLYFSPLRYEGAAGEGDTGGDGAGFGGGEQKLEGKARLNDQGSAEISVPLAINAYGNDRETYGSDYTARIEARVTDASGREVSGSAGAVATYGRYLLLLSPDRYVHSAGETAVFTLRAVDYEGAPQAGARAHLVLERFDYPNGPASAAKITTVQQADVAADGDGQATWPVVVPAQPGSYRVRATAPSEGRQVSDVAFMWVPGRTERGAGTEEQVLELVSDRRLYQPDETARLIVRGAEFDASVLVTKENQYVSFHRVVKARNNEAIDVPVTADDVGDTYVSISFLKDDRLYRAERRLNVPATRHQLTITAVPDRPVVRPGEPGTFMVRVSDAAGAPVRAQLSLGLVDEAVYGVRQDTTPDPLRFFYRREYSRVATQFSRNYSFVGFSGTDQLLLARRRRLPMTLADFKAERPDRPRVRKDFPDTVFWAADVTTNTDGQARVRIEYPDSLTSWRLTARAVTVATDVGVALAHTTTTKDLILQVVTPRFLTEGDQVTIPAIVHSYLPDAKAVSVSLSAEGLAPVDAAAPASRSIQVASGGEQRIDWRFTADLVRAVTVTGRAIADAAGDAIQLSLPVRPAGLQRTAGSSGSLPEAGERTLELTVPSTANASARSVRVALAPSLAGTMLGALDYLTSYPWGCTEQTLSSFVPNLVVLRTMSQMGLAPTERLRALDRQVDDGLKRLYDYQHEDGGWGWWKTDQNHPFMTAYALDGMLQARDHDVKVEPYRIDSAAQALRRLYAQYPRAVPDLKAYEVYVLARVSSATDTSKAGTFSLSLPLDDLWGARSRMTSTGRALLLMVLDRTKDPRASEAARELVAAAETRGDLSWWSAREDQLLEDVADTSVEASALALHALSARDPRNPLLERVARWLVLNRTGGFWISTKQTALALQGLLAFTQARGERPSPVAAEVFVNGARVGSHSFDAQSLTAPDPILIESPAAAGANNIRIVTKGAGALYYDASVRYYDRAAADARSGSRKLALVRSYATLSPVQKDGRIVYREGAFNGAARPGDVLLVRLTVAGSPDWRYLMLEDPIPAGTEQVEKEDLYELEQRRAWRFGSARERRDDRTVFFLNNLPDGRDELTYLLKVTTPGVFNAMPAHISPMYVPEVSASSTATKLTVPADAVR